MAVTTSTQTSSGGLWKHLALAMGGLALMLLISFHEGLKPNMVHFNNDAPMGLVKSQEENAMANLRGVWNPLNWVGLEQPSGQPEPGNFYFQLTGTELFCKTFPVFALFFLGFSAWVLFRSLKFHPLVCFAGAVAAAFNTNAFSNACWGLGTWSLARGMILLSLAALISHRDRPHWSKLVIAGAAIGFNIMEAFDTGAIYSIYVAAFAVVLAWSKTEGTPAVRTGRGILHVAIIAFFAALVAAHVVSNLIGTQVKGVVGMEQTAEAKEKRWNEATLWSLPKIETLRLVVPGLFGYRMQTPDGSAYWGGVGAPEGAPQYRSSGSGEYAGLLVVLLAGWALAQSLRKEQSEALPRESRYILWFCAIAGFISLLLCFGRFAPFYKLVYSLPYFSTIRNPIKFTSPLHISLLIMFGFGLNHLVRAYLSKADSERKAWTDAWKNFRKLPDSTTRKLVFAGWLLTGAGLLATLIYASSSADIVKHLQNTGFPPENPAEPSKAALAIASFSVTEAFLSALLLGLCTLIVWGGVSGWLRARMALSLLIGVLVLDLLRANAPWVNFYDHTYRYASNPAIDFLKANAPPWRTASELMPLTRSYLVTREAGGVGGIFNYWLQQHYQYYRIHSLDITQMPRIPEMESAYFNNLRPADNDTYKIARMWELTSTRYIIGQAVFISDLNQSIDPVKKRFSIQLPFAIAAKPGVTQPQGADDYTAVPSDKGPFAIFEFKGALPRASLFTNWVAGVSDEAALKRLQEPGFDPASTVLISEPISAPGNTAGNGINTVSDTKFETRSVSLKVEVAQESILLLNDRHSSSWKVTVDGSERPLLRANYLMRGVQLKPGDKEVVFTFDAPTKYLKITLAAIFGSLGLLIWWPIRERKMTDKPVAK